MSTELQQEESSAELAPASERPKAPVPGSSSDKYKLASTTHAAYKRIGLRLFKSAVHRHSIDPHLPANISPVQVVQDLIARFKDEEMTAATWRLYKSALLWHLDQILQEAPSNEHTLQAIALLQSASVPNRGNDSVPKRTSAKRRRTISQPDMQALITELNGGKDSRKKDSKNQWRLIAGHWFLAAVGTGLRPVEWDSAKLSEDGTSLTVTNAKNTNGRGTGMPTRTVEIDPKYRIYVQILISELSLAKARGYEFGQIYSGARQALRRACKALWKGERYFTLYTGRGQFSANQKAVSVLPEVSAQMGHRSTKTTQRFYGKRRFAHGQPHRDLASDSQRTVETQAQEATQQLPFTAHDLSN